MTLGYDVFFDDLNGCLNMNLNCWYLGLEWNEYCTQGLGIMIMMCDCGFGGGLSYDYNLLIMVIKRKQCNDDREEENGLLLS